MDLVHWECFAKWNYAWPRQSACCVTRQANTEVKEREKVHKMFIESPFHYYYYNEIL